MNKDLVEALAQLKALYDADVLTEMEYRMEREKLLNGTASEPVAPQIPYATPTLPPKKKGRGKAIGTGVLAVAVAGGLTAWGVHSGVVDFSKIGKKDTVEESSALADLETVSLDTILTVISGSWYDMNGKSVITWDFKPDGTVVRLAGLWQSEGSIHKGEITHFEIDGDGVILTIDFESANQEAINKEVKIRVEYDLSKNPNKIILAELDENNPATDFQRSKNYTFDTYNSLSQFMEEKFGQDSKPTKNSNQSKQDSQPNLPTVSDKEITTFVRNFIDAWGKGTRTKDSSSIVSFLEPNSIAYDEELESIKASINKGSSIVIDVETTSISQNSDGTYDVRTSEFWTITRTDGVRTYHQEEKFTLVLKNGNLLLRQSEVLVTGDIAFTPSEKPSTPAQTPKDEKPVVEAPKAPVNQPAAPKEEVPVIEAPVVEEPTIPSAFKDINAIGASYADFGALTDEDLVWFATEYIMNDSDYFQKAAIRETTIQHSGSGTYQYIYLTEFNSDSVTFRKETGSKLVETGKIYRDRVERVIIPKAFTSINEKGYSYADFGYLTDEDLIWFATDYLMNNSDYFQNSAIKETSIQHNGPGTYQYIYLSEVSADSVTFRKETGGNLVEEGIIYRDRIERK